MSRQTAQVRQNQGRWNQYGEDRIKEIEKHEAGFIVSDSPYRYLQVHADLMNCLNPLERRRVLELGCGLGDFSVFLSKHGADVTGIDIGPDLVTASRLLAKVNHATCQFEVASVVELPFRANTYELVLGIAILHHLSKPELRRAVAETWRVLMPGGQAVFYEPVENSRAFDFVQNLFPAGKKDSGYYRPSILQRQAWRSYVRELDDRDLTNQELIAAGEPFSTMRIRPYGLLVRLERLLGGRYVQSLTTFDAWLFRKFPSLARLSQTVLVEFGK